MKCIFIGYSDENKGCRLLSDGKFIVSRDVIFYETESKILDEINHLLSRLEKKNTKGKGKLNKSKKFFWFEKDFVSPEDISLSNSSSDSSHNETTKDSFDTKSSKESSPTSDISNERRASFFENPLFNNNGDSDHQSPQHKKPKWDEQLLKDVHSDEMNKTGTRRSSREEGNFSHAYTEPTSFVEASGHKEWQEVMINEYDSVLANGTWNLADCPHDVKPIGCKWVYRLKYKPNGKIDKYTTRLVAKGFSQWEGIDYEETFAPTTKWNTIIMVINLAANNGWKLHQIDFKSVFLNGDLKEDIFMTQPQGFEAKG
jgi:hypothetical protein